MINANFFLGIPDSFKQKFYIYPPDIETRLRTEKYNTYYKILTTSQEDIEDFFIEKDVEGKPPTPFEYLLNSAYNDKNFESIASQAFEFFIKQPITFFYEEKKILIGDLKEKIVNDKLNNLTFLEEGEYFDFQNMIRQAHGDKEIEPPSVGESERVKKIKAKARYRDKVKAKEGKGVSLGMSLAAICCMNSGLSPLNIGKISGTALEVLLRTYQDKEKYDTDIRSLLAGASVKDVKPKYWIKNSNEE